MMKALNVAPVAARVWALIAVGLGGLGQGLINPRLPDLFQGSNHLALAASLSAALMYLGIFALTPVMGKACDKGYIRAVLRGGLFVYAIALASFSLGPSPTLIFVLRLVEGLALSGVYVGTEFVLSRLSGDHDRARWLSLSGVFLSVGLLGGPLLSYLGFGSALLAVCALSIAVIIFAKLSDSRLTGEEDLLPMPALSRGPLLAGFLYGFIEAGLVAVFAVLAVTTFGVSPDRSLVFIIVSALIGAGIGGVIGDMWGARRTVLATLAVFALCALAASFAPESKGYLGSGFITLVVFAALVGALYPAALAWLLNPLAPQSFGRATASFSRAYSAGALMGPVVVGFAVEFSPVRGLFVICSLTGILGFIGIVRSTEKTAQIKKAKFSQVGKEAGLA